MRKFSKDNSFDAKENVLHDIGKGGARPDEILARMNDCGIEKVTLHYERGKVVFESRDEKGPF